MVSGNPAKSYRTSKWSQDQEIKPLRGHNDLTQAAIGIGFRCLHQSLFGEALDELSKCGRMHRGLLTKLGKSDGLHVANNAEPCYLTSIDAKGILDISM